MGWMVNATPRLRYLRGKSPTTHCKRGGWATGSVWTDGGKRKSLDRSEVRTADRPARCESLYRIRYLSTFLG